jgi:hypothetical protein
MINRNQYTFMLYLQMLIHHKEIMSMFKKKVSLISFLLFSTLAIIPLISSAAISPSTNQHIDIFVPNLKPGFAFNVTALALKPGASNLNYAISNKALPIASPGWTEKELRPGYAPAFMLSARYQFLEGKDIKIDWTHLNSSTSASVSAPTNQYFIGPDFDIGPDAGNIRQAYGNANFKYDVINLDAGQMINIGEHTAMRLFLGLSNTYLREQVTAIYFGEITTGSPQGLFSSQQEVTANFTGIGPRFGVDINYMTMSNIGFFGNVGASALTGSTYSKTTYLTSTPAISNNRQYIKDQNVTQVIPAFDAKLGVNYMHIVNKDMLLTIEGGYQGAVYINAISQYLPGALVNGITTGGIYVATMSHTISNYSVQGFFLGATLQM